LLPLGSCLSYKLILSLHTIIGITEKIMRIKLENKENQGLSFNVLAAIPLLYKLTKSDRLSKFQPTALPDNSLFFKTPPSGLGGLRLGYQGEFAEKDGETEWNSFELRQYDRWWIWWW
jgi:hypothetical protein